MKIQIYGLGGRRYRQLRDNLLHVISELQITGPIEIEEISDIDKIVQSGITTVPGIKVDGQPVEKEGKNLLSIMDLKAFFNNLQAMP